MTFITYLPLFVSMLTAAPGPKVAQGEPAPVFTAADSEGHMLDLSALIKKGPVVLAFFPKAKTSGCTQQMRALVQHQSMLQKYHATVLAISYDDAASMQAFRSDLGASFAFVPDPTGALMRLYDAKIPLVTVAKRKTFIVGLDGKIVFISEGSDAIALTGMEQALKTAQLATSQ